MTNTVTVPVNLGGTGTTYSDGTDAHGMKGVDGYGWQTNLFPMLSEVVAAGNTVVTIVGPVHDDLANINLVAADLANVNLVAADLTHVDAVAGDLVNIDAVAPHVANVDIVAGSIASVNTAAVNIALIQSAPTNAQTASDQAALANQFQLTATAQAALAISAAASASSVAQQDLSGTAGLAQALYRSPNAIVAMCPIDTSKDSEGGAWVEKCGNLSYLTETLNGNWLGWQASEAAARAVGGTLGSEAITGADPGFGSATGWTTGTGASVSGGLLNLSSVANGVGATTTGTASVIGTVYKVICTRSISAGGVRVTYGGQNFDFYGADTTPIYLAATSASTAVSVVAIGTTTGSVDAVSIKPITANVTNTSDFFGNRTDGKFYSLNAGSGITEVFRGSKAKPGRGMHAVAEGGALNIFDTREPGYPMWMRFVANVANNAIPGSIAGAQYINGGLLVATNAGAVLIDFAGDRVFCWSTAGLRRYRGKIADRNSGSGWDVVDSTKALPSNTVNAVSVCQIPEAPVDPVTGLAAPLIVLGTASGGSMILPDGTVRNSAATTNFTNVSVSPYAAWFSTSAGTALSYILQPATAGASFALSSIASGAAPGLPVLNWSGMTLAKRGMIFRRSGTRVDGLLVNESSPTQSIGFAFADTWNAGGWVGAIARAFMCDTYAGAINSTEQMTPPDMSATGNWQFGTVGTSTAAAISGGAMSLPRTNSTNYSYGYQSFTAGAGRTWQLQVTVGAGQGNVLAKFGSAANLTDNTALASQTCTAGTTTTITLPTSLATVSVTLTPVTDGATPTVTLCSVKGCVADRSYKGARMLVVGTLTAAQIASGSQPVAYTGWNASNYVQEAYSADYDFATAGFAVPVLLKYSTAGAGTIFDRSAATGASWTFGTDASGHLTLTVSDGTTSRTATTTAAYNTGQPIVAVPYYLPSGTVGIAVNGKIVATTTGNPLLTLTNATAVFTVGNNRALSAPFASTDYIGMLKPTGTVPNADALAWAYELEKEMFQPGAQVTLPDSGSVAGIWYDSKENALKVVSAGYESKFVGFVRTSSAPVSAGSFTGVLHDGGIKLTARSTTNPGVDITIPAINAKEEYLRQGALYRAQGQELKPLDWVGGFTANTNSASSPNALQGVTLATNTWAGSIYPSATTVRGSQITGTGIPAGTLLSEFEGTTVIRMTANATATGTAVPIAFVDYILPVGQEAKAVYVNGSRKREGSTYDFTRLYDGFRETIRFNSGAVPGATALVAIDPRKAVQ